MFTRSIVKVLFHSLPLSLSISLGAVFMTSVSQAEIIKIPIASQADDLQDIPRPERGSSKENVLAEYGNALTTNDSVGEPPISRWEYQDFYVVFESNYVIHTFLKHRAKHMP